VRQQWKWDLGKIHRNLLLQLQQ